MEDDDVRRFLPRWVVLLEDIVEEVKKKRQKESPDPPSHDSKYEERTQK